MAKGTSPTQRTLRELRRRGYRVDIVERWLPIPGGFGRRRDLFNIIDIIALTPTGILGVQSCGSSFSEHWKKLTEDEAEQTRAWLETPGTALELWGWRKVKRKRGGKAMVWKPRVKQVELLDLDCYEPHSIENDPDDNSRLVRHRRRQRQEQK